jgi:hypothetical protein
MYKLNFPRLDVQLSLLFLICVAPVSALSEDLRSYFETSGPDDNHVVPISSVAGGDTEAKRQRTFAADMNGDGTITISDVSAWIGWLFFYPGDYIVYLILSDSPGIARFLEEVAHFFEIEITPLRYGGL